MAKNGRPTIFTQELANEICRRIMDGESLRAICTEENMPNRSSVHLWLSIHKSFSDQYALAKLEQADTLADDIIYIADNAKDANIARLQIDTRKWAASKLKPKKYGDKIDIESKGEVVHKYEDMTDEQLEAAIKARKDRAA